MSNLNHHRRPSPLFISSTPSTREINALEIDRRIDRLNPSPLYPASLYDRIDMGLMPNGTPTVPFSLPTLLLQPVPEVVPFSLPAFLKRVYLVEVDSTPSPLNPDNETMDDAELDAQLDARKQEGLDAVTVYLESLPEALATELTSSSDLRRVLSSVSGKSLFRSHTAASTFASHNVVSEVEEESAQFDHKKKFREIERYEQVVSEDALNGHLNKILGDWMGDSSAVPLGSNSTGLDDGGDRDLAGASRSIEDTEQEVQGNILALHLDPIIKYLKKTLFEDENDADDEDTVDTEEDIYDEDMYDEDVHEEDMDLENSQTIPNVSKKSSIKDLFRRNWRNKSRAVIGNTEVQADKKARSSKENKARRVGKLDRFVSWIGKKCKGKGKMDV
ncbi:hypothetical protein WAI453_008934 [Rhynchosporium graminicola]|uniref:Uncharacterized protein n=1 Tax=Rhynchosporium graminicola TaxID=2792576 RepID=A0A1E1LPT3_9HELO|nr:uncharacterized protein RCO7_07671 [Rhynchosporium commune]